MSMKTKQQGMTLVEVAITVSIIGLLAAFVVPAVNKLLERRNAAQAASKLRIAVNAFELCKAETGSYPLDKTPAQVPPEMTDYFADLGIYDAASSDDKRKWWVSTTPVGGRWDWDEGYHFAYSVSISAPTASSQALKDLDAMLDDGDLETGRFRRVSSQYHYILEE